MKILYSFKLKKPSNGEELELAIRKPTRAEIDETDMLLSVFQSEYIKKGILTKEMMLKAYKNFGGAMSEDEIKEYRKLTASIYEVHGRMEKAKSKKEKDRLQREYDMLWLALSKINGEHEQLFSRTADVHARNKTILHLVLLLGLQKDGEDWKNIFSGNDFEERYESYAILEEEDSDDAESILTKVSSFLTFWYYGDKNLSEQDFKDYDRLVYGEPESELTEPNKEG